MENKVVDDEKNGAIGEIEPRALTRKEKSKLRREAEEEKLKASIRKRCDLYGMFCRFYLESVIINSPVAKWQFAYHDRLKTLWHESTVKINFETGDYAAMLNQFRNRRMTCEEVIDYIARHDGLSAAIESDKPNLLSCENMRCPDE